MLEAIQNAGLVPSDLDWLLLHQANIRIMEHAAEVLGISMDKVLRNIAEYGNTSAGKLRRVISHISSHHEHTLHCADLCIRHVHNDIHIHIRIHIGSIPLALTEAVQAGKVKKGDIIAISGFGAGLNWGAAVIRWGG